jgi:hypothetical protein
MSLTLGPNDSGTSSHPTPMDSASDRQLYADTPEKVTESTEAANPRAANSSRWKKVVVIGAIVLICIILAIVLPVYFLVIKKKSSSTTGGSGGGGGGGDTTGPVAQPGGVSESAAKSLIECG